MTIDDAARAALCAALAMIALGWAVDALFGGPGPSGGPWRDA